MSWSIKPSPVEEAVHLLSKIFKRPIRLVAEPEWNTYRILFDDRHYFLTLAEEAVERAWELNR